MPPGPPHRKHLRPPAARLRLRVPPRFSLRETVLSHGWHQMAPFRWERESSTLERVESLPGGALCLLRIGQRGGTGTGVVVRTRPSVPGRADRRVLRSRLVRMLGLSQDLSAFHRLCGKEPELRSVGRRGAGWFLRAGTLYEDVFKALCATNISWNQAVRAVNRLMELGEPLEGSDLRAFPSPQRILAAGAGRLSEVSRLGYRVPYLLSWAGRVVSQDPGVKAAEEESPGKDELRELLMSVRGVGRATCRYLLMLHGVGEEIPVDSSAFQFLRETRFAGRNPTPAQIERLYRRFGPWKAHAYWFQFLPWARRHWALDRPIPSPHGATPREGASSGRTAQRKARR